MKALCLPGHAAILKMKFPACRAIPALLMGLFLFAHADHAAQAATQSSEEDCRKAAGFDEKGNWSAAFKVADDALAVCEAAHKQHPDSASIMAYLGRLYYRAGRNDESFALIEASAKKGSVAGLGLLGVEYEYGYGVEKDYDQAAAWYRKAAEKGMAVAQGNLGLAYLVGRGAPMDMTAAVAWLAKAAAQGHAEAQFFLGAQYADGIAVERDDAEAKKWFTKAADQGYVPAREALGRMKARAEEFAKTLNRAQHTDVKSDDEWKVGMMYSEGYGTAQNYDEAFSWFSRAAQSSHPGAMEQFRIIADKLTALDTIARNARLGDEDASNAMRKYAMPYMLPGTLFRDCPACPQLRLVPSGAQHVEYTDIAGKSHVSDLMFIRSFGIGKLEITRGQWQAITASPAPASSSTCKTDDCPVLNLSQEEAREFIRKLSAKTGAKYYLANDAECAYACRSENRQYCGYDTPRTANYTGEKRVDACDGFGIRIVRTTE